MSSTCTECGCKVYGGYCVNCHEEHYITEQNNINDKMIAFSDEFCDKVKAQDQKVREIRIAEADVVLRVDEQCYGCKRRVAASYMTERDGRKYCQGC